MAVIFADGFDHYQAPLLKWSSRFFAGNPPSQTTRILPASGRNNSGALFLPARTGSAFGGSGQGGCMYQKNIGAHTTITIGAAFNFDFSSGNNDSQVIAWVDGVTTQVDLRVSRTGILYFTRGGTLLGTASPFSLASNAWNYIEAQVTINGVTGSCVLHVNGTTWLNITGQNTLSSGFAQVSGIDVGCMCPNGTAFATFIDDLYVTDTNAPNASFLGDIAVRGIMPNGNGTSLQYTMNAKTWAASTLTGVGEMLLDSNNNLQLAIAVTSDAKTAGTTPTWNVTVGGNTTDNHVTWKNIGAQAQFLEVNQNPPMGVGPRLTATSYPIGTMVWDENGILQICTTAGISGNNDVPLWGTTIGSTTADNTVIWTYFGYGEDTYISDSTIGHISRFVYPPIIGSAIKTVVVTMRARKDDVSTRSVRGATISGGVVGASGSDLPLLTNYQYVQGMLDTDPNTGVAWTVAAVNAAEFGIKTTA